MVKKICLFLSFSAFLVAVLFFYNSNNTEAKYAEKEPIDKLEKKGQPMEHFYGQRAYPDEHMDVKAYTDALRAVKNQMLAEDDSPGFDQEWTVQGPGNIGARVNSVAVHPTNENIMYAGFSQGGVWKTTDGGANWIPVFDEQTFLAIGDIIFDPSDPETVYVGTGDVNIPHTAHIGDGLYKTTDGGATWTHLGLEAQRIISKIAVDPTNSDVIFAATMGLPFERNNDRGLYKSIDGGSSWDQVLFISDSTGIIDLMICLLYTSPSPRD